ncbi:AS3MT methyltransferase, partial [Atractosteus spatula]|nr:AS3MT methyltransferase [Atractosteus spatula]
MATPVHENVQKYYGCRLEKSRDLQTNANCALPSCPVPKSVLEALKLVHPEVRERYFGCGLIIPEKLEGCNILDLGSGSGRDCYILGKLVGGTGLVIGVDMTQELILMSRKYIQYHQEKFGFEKPNTVFVQGYVEKLYEVGIQDDYFDVLVSGCVICLCPDKAAVLKEAYRVLKEGGELYFSDVYASKTVPENVKQDEVLWGEGLGGSLYWMDLISLVKDIGFSRPYLVAASHIVIRNSELLEKTGDITYASGTYRVFKLPENRTNGNAIVTYQGTVSDHPDQLVFDASHTFKKGVAIEVDAETAAVLQYSRFSSDFSILNADAPLTIQESSPPYSHLNPFLLADRLGASMLQCSKSGARVKQQ